MSLSYSDISWGTKEIHSNHAEPEKASQSKEPQRADPGSLVKNGPINDSKTQLPASNEAAGEKPDKKIRARKRLMITSQAPRKHHNQRSRREQIQVAQEVKW